MEEVERKNHDGGSDLFVRSIDEFCFRARVQAAPCPRTTASRRALPSKELELQLRDEAQIEIQHAGRAFNRSRRERLDETIFLLQKGRKNVLNDTRQKNEKKIVFNLSVFQLSLLILRGLPTRYRRDDRRSRSSFLLDLAELPALLPRRDPSKFGFFCREHLFSEEECDARGSIADGHQEHRRLEPYLLLEQGDS